MKNARKRIAAIVLICIFAFGAVGCGGKKGGSEAAVISAIDNLPIVSELTIGDASAVEDARTLYDALSSGDQAKVTNYDKLTAAEAVLGVLSEIAALSPSFTSGNTAIVGVAYVPQITGYAYNDTATTVTYSLKSNTAGAVLNSSADPVSITAANAGSFTVEATVSYAGYNVKRNAELSVTVTEPPAPVRTLSGQLTCASTFGASVDYTGATLKIGTYAASVNPDGSWTASVPDGTYNVVATHPTYAAAPIEGFVVDENETAPEVKFELYAAKGYGTNAASVYDWEKKAYNQAGGTFASGNATIDFTGMKVEEGEEFVFQTEILYSTNTGAGGNWKYGLVIHDGKPTQERDFSFGLFLANDYSSAPNGRFCAYIDLGKTGGNTGRYTQGNPFNVIPVLPATYGERTITLTYARKNVSGALKWYMVAEWDSTGDGVADQRFARQPGPTFANDLTACDDKALYLGLTFGIDVSSGETKCGNVYFAKGSAAVNAVDLEEGITSPAATIGAIAALPAASALTLSDAPAVEAARALYNALTSKTQASVTNYDKLTAAEAVIAVLQEINELTPIFTSSQLATINVAYEPQITGYAYSDVGTTVEYSLKDNTAGAVLNSSGDPVTITPANAGAFTVVATVSYTGYNITKRAELAVTVPNPETPKRNLSGTLSCDSTISSNVDYTGATLSVGPYEATVNANGSWSVNNVEHGTYTVTATHPMFLTKTITDFAVNASSSAPTIEFTTFKATGGVPSGSTFAYDENNSFYQATGGAINTGVSRIHFNGMSVSQNADFVFSAELVYTGSEGASSGTLWQGGVFHHGLGVYDGAQDIKQSDFSYGLLLTNSYHNGSTFKYEANFSAYENVDIATNANGLCEHKGMQGESFGFGFGIRPDGVTTNIKPDGNDDKKIVKLTYIRKNNAWYMIAEWPNADWTTNNFTKRNVRQLDSAIAESLNAKATIYLCLVNQVAAARVNGTPPNDNVVKWRNVFFATGTGVADAIVLS